jgi:FtsH-binding integral membrane protein
MTNNTNQDWAEKWVLHIGRKALRFGKWATLIPFVIAGIFGFGLLLFVVLVFYIKGEDALEGAILGASFATGTVGSVLSGIVYFERRHFYKIIQGQKGKMEQLEKELRDKH